MALDKFFAIFTAIIGVAMAMVLVTSTNTAAIIKAWGDAFSGSLKVATGK